MTKYTTSQLRELYPVADVYTPLGGIDIQRTSSRITALVAVEDERGGRDIRFYSWQRRGKDDHGEWKVDLARLSTQHWNFGQISRQAKGLAKKYDVKSYGV